jgi:hypothetical protein
MISRGRSTPDGISELQQNSERRRHNPIWLSWEFENLLEPHFRKGEIQQAIRNRRQGVKAERKFTTKI